MEREVFELVIGLLAFKLRVQVLWIAKPLGVEDGLVFDATHPDPSTQAAVSDIFVAS